MRKVLAGFIMDGHGGGVDNYLLNFLENVHTQDIEVDLLTNNIDKELEKYLSRYHSHIFAIANLKHPIKQFRQVCGIIERGQYDVVYLNISTAIDCVAALAAKRKKVRRILVHSHSSGNDCENPVKREIFNAIHYFCRIFLFRAATEFYGCSKKAGLWLFPRRIVESEKFKTIFNAVDLGKYKFNPQVRNEVRKELKIENKFVVGHVGSFSYAKNHFFLIDIFEKILARNPDAVLLLAGDGVRFEKVKALVQKKKLEDSVRILGFRKDVNRLLQGMDFFLLPSCFEGLPTVSIEAQCTGLPCLMSDKITDEAKITSDCWFLSLKKSPEEWAKFVLTHKKNNRTQIQWMGRKENYSLKELKKQQQELIMK